MAYNPKNPMEDRISDIGPRHYGEFLPPVIKENKGKWLYHEILEVLSFIPRFACKIKSFFVFIPSV